MFGTYFFVFFEGKGKERVAQDFKELVEGLLGEEAGVGRAFERPWEDPALVKRPRTPAPAGGLSGDEPWYFARSVFEFPTYEEHFRGESFDDFGADDDARIFDAEAFEEEDSSLYLFGSDMPPEWQEAPVTISFPPFALPAQTKEERQASRPKAKKILRWLCRQQRRRRVQIQLSAGFFAPVYFEPAEVSAARLLTMALELQEISAEEAPPHSVPLDLDLGFEDPEAGWQEPKDSAHWPARIWRKLVS